MKTTIIIALLTPLIYAQGSLSPGGAPAPSMKTLEQIEARKSIPASPATPIAGPHFTISQPGSYYLTGNIEVASGTGIVITAPNVTLDLNGFTLTSKTVAPASGPGIAVQSTGINATIKNGHISGGSTRTPTSGGQPWEASFSSVGWTYGVFSDALATSIDNINVEKCANNGILCQKNASIQNVSATNNGYYGIQIASGGGTISHCTSLYNNNIGISGSVVSHCVSKYNNYDGISGVEVSHCEVESCGRIGIFASGGIVSYCRSKSNFNEGIYVRAGIAAFCVASGNSLDTSNVDTEIFVISGGQRVSCVPATE